ncbi:hypothetical protein SOVF_173540, partial [Spinacia oleracea]
MSQQWSSGERKMREKEKGGGEFNDKLSRDIIKEKKVFVNSSVLGDSFDDVITIPEIFGMDLDDVRVHIPAINGKKSMSKKTEKGKLKPKKSWLDPLSMSCGL